MIDLFNSPEPKKESNPLINYVIAGIGLIFMLCACSLMPLILVRNGRSQTTRPVISEEPFVYSGQQIHHVPAGSRSITALSYSSQAPVIVMFDADW